MPYSPDHKPQTRRKILDAAARLFKKHGYQGVSIDLIMAEAGLTRGGFYAHFSNKEDLFAEALTALQPPESPAHAPAPTTAADVLQMVETYLSGRHLSLVENGCPVVPLSPDIARLGGAVQDRYRQVVEGMVNRLAEPLPDGALSGRDRAIALFALSVGGLTIARALGSPEQAADTLKACREAATLLAGEQED